MPKTESTSETHNTHSPFEVKTLLTWKAKARPFRKRKREFFLMIIFVAICFIMISFFFNEWMLILLILSMVFLAFVLFTIEPHDVEHRITTQGVITGDHAYLYNELYDFWFDEKDGHHVLHLRTYNIFPGVLSLILEGVHKDLVRDVLVKFMPYREVVAKSFLDKASVWLAKNFPLESKT